MNEYSRPARRRGRSDSRRPAPGAPPSPPKREPRPGPRWEPPRSNEAGGEGRGQAGAVNRSRPIYESNGQTNRSWRGRRERSAPPDRRERSAANDPRGRNAPYDRSRGGYATGPGAIRRERGRRGGPRPNSPRPVGDDEQQTPLPSNPREAALRILHAVETRGAYSDRLLDGAHARGGPDARDLALMHELVKGTLRWRGRIDWTLDPLVHIGLSNVHPWARNALRIGAYQMLFLDRIPVHAAVDESVKLTHRYGHPGTAGLVNSVLRRLAEVKDSIAVPSGDDAESLSIWGSHPRWMVERWLERFGVDRTRALLLANNRAARAGLRANRMRGTREELIQKLAAEGVAASPAALAQDLVWIDTAHAPASLAVFRQGVCTVQDESEALVGRLVDPHQHERALDLCAAPGGKCTHLAELMDDDGEVWAMELAPPRVTALENTVKRLGLHAVHVVQGDGRSYAFPMPFDRVLVDAPCTGLGVLARRADARWRKTPELLREMPPIQLDLLAAGGRRLRPGGVLVYSVCSFEPEETTQVVERFLRANPQFMLESSRGLVPDAVVADDGCMHVLPHIHGCDGAFAARFRKT